MRHLGLVLLCLLSCLAWGRVAAATPRDLIVHLGSPSDPAPSNVCVASVGAPDQGANFGDQEVVVTVNPQQNDYTISRVKQPAPQSCSWRNDGDKAASSTAPCDVDADGSPRMHESLKSSGECSPKFTMPRDRAFQCVPNVLPSKEDPTNLAVLEVEETISTVELVGNELRIRFELNAARENLKKSVKVRGGDYTTTSATPTRQQDGSLAVNLPLVARCTNVAFSVPEAECPLDPESVTASPPKSTALSAPPTAKELRTLTLTDGGDGNSRLTHPLTFAGLPNSFELPLPTNAQGGHVELTTCGGKHRFAADWPRLPPAQVRLEAIRIVFDWRRDELAWPDSCPEVSLPQATCKEGVEIPKREHTPAELVKELDGLEAPDPHTDSRCRYVCSSNTSIALPASVSFSQYKFYNTAAANEPLPEKPLDAPSTQRIADEWSIALSHAGEVIHGYLPPERRYILLRKDWDKERASRFGDRIAGIEMQTPDGRSHSLSTEALGRIAVPNLQAGDTVTYTYVGTRAFRQQSALVSRGGIVDLADPDLPGKDQHQRKIQPAFSLWVGWRGISGAHESTRWNPSGGIEFSLGFTCLRVYTKKNGTYGGPYVEPALHLGLNYSSMAFESVFMDEGRPQATWSNIPLIVFPFELGLRTTPITDDLELELGVGGALYRQVFSSDAERVAPSFALSAPRADLMVHVTRSFSLGLTLRYLWVWARRVEMTLDEGGIAERDEKHTAMFQGGLAARFDDIF